MIGCTDRICCAEVAVSIIFTLNNIDERNPGYLTGGGGRLSVEWSRSVGRMVGRSSDTVESVDCKLNCCVGRPVGRSVVGRVESVARQAALYDLPANIVIQ